MRLFFLPILLFFLHPNFGEAQKSGGTEKANKVYEKLGYRQAIDLYKEGKLDMASMERMANSYRLNHDTQNAEKWYAQIVQSSDNPMSFLYYAQALQSNGSLGKAKEYYLKYDKMMGASNDARGSRLAHAIDRMVELRHPKEIEVSNVGSINSDLLDFSPAYHQNGVVFVSNRKPKGELAKLNTSKDLWTGNDFAGLYFAPLNEDGKLGEPKNFSIGLATRYHEGPLTFSKTGDQLFFTRNDKKRKKSEEVKLSIYTADKSGDDFGEAKKMDLGEDNANDAHPSLSANGQQLYFASDRAGGYGGMDIYVSNFTEGKWGTPINLGANINTPGNEVFPYVYDDGTLYFASDGWGGLGGLDIFFAEQMAENTLSESANIGAPFNSNMDDFGYVLNTLGTEGYFTSARTGGKGKDDIYHFSLPTPQANKKRGEAVAVICVYDQATGERIEGAQVTVLAEEGDGSYTGFEEDFVVKLMPTDRPDEFAISLKKRDPFAGGDGINETYTTDANGDFSLPLSSRSKYVLMSKVPGYQDVTYELDASKGISEHCIPMMAGNCIALNGRAMNQEYMIPLPNATISMLNLCTGEALSTRADAGGNYSFCLDCGCDFVLTGKKSNFKDGSAVVSTADRGCESGDFGPPIYQDVLLVPDTGNEGVPAIASYREEGRSENKSPVEHWPTDPEVLNDMLEEGIVIELEDIYYDLDKYFIRPDAAVELDKVVKFMHRNPEIYVEMRSHTDSRSSREYNRTLSSKRAKAAVAYIVERGVEGYRITAAGYGEELLVNDCADGVDCDENAHQRNRRTEVRVYKNR